MKRIFYILLIFIGLSTGIGTLQSCSEDDDCSLNARPMMECSICKIDTGEHTVTDTLNAVTITALGTDSVIINQMENATSLSLPLRYSKDTTTFVFNYYQDNLTDTMVVVHTNTPYFLTLNCGFQMKQQIVSIGHTTNVIKSVVISDTNANIYGTENIQIIL